MIGEWVDAIGALHFLRPGWLLLWPLLIVAGLWWRRHRQRQTPWTSQVDAHLLPHLLAEAGHAAGRRRAWLWPVTVSLFCLALAGPAWRELPQPQLDRQAGLVILLDLSDGMRAGDVAPSRLQRARYKIADLLRQRKDGQTALIAYAGDAFTVAPLTDDAATLEALLSALEPDVMPVPGQRLVRGLDLAEALLRGGGFPGGDVLLLSYRASDEDIAAAARIADAGVRISVLAVGSEVGAPVPLPQGGFLRDDAGELLLPRLDMASLQRLVAPSGGSVVGLRGDSLDVAELLATFDNNTGEGRLRDDQRSLRHADEGPWVILLLLPFALLLIRRVPVLALVPVFLLGAVPQTAQALEWSALWQRPDQRAWQALQEERYADARVEAESPALRGAAAYREGDYATAAQEFAAATDPAALYNRGTALAQEGKLEEALAALDAALKAQPGLADARHNREVVQQALQKKQQQEQQQSSPSEGDDGEASDDGKSEGEQEGEQQDSPKDQAGKPGDEQGEQGESEQGSSEDDTAASDEQQAGDDQREAMEQALREAEESEEKGEGRAAPPLDPAAAEKQQAADQWLRRIPDDPGGLLRRKFALEHRRRVMAGEQ